MNYPTVFIDKEVTQAYNVKAYPTFYVIDAEGRVALSMVGFDPLLKSKIDSTISALLPHP
jgi:thioredoxin-related protein